MKIEAKLKELGLFLPQAPKPAGNYVPVSLSDKILYTSGILPLEGGKLNYNGSFDSVFSVEQGQKMAGLCVMNALSAIKDIIADLDRIIRIIKLNGFIRSDKGFSEQSKILNGASDLLVKIFGENGRHTRSAIGVSELPLGSPVELELIMEIERG